MTQTGEVVIGKNKYQMKQGYILVKPLAEQFQKNNKDVKMRRITNWNQGKRSELDLSTEAPASISIEGSKEVKGTYFRPDIVIDVLEWLCPAFKSEIKAVYESYVVEQNTIR